MLEKIYARIREMRYASSLSEMAQTIAYEFNVPHRKAEEIILLCAFSDAIMETLG